MNDNQKLLNISQNDLKKSEDVVDQLRKENFEQKNALKNLASVRFNITLVHRINRCNESEYFKNSRRL